MQNDPVLVQLVLDGERLARLVGGASPRMELVTMNTGKVLASVPMAETTPDAVRAATRALVASQAPGLDGPARLREIAAKRAAAQLKLARAHGITFKRETGLDKSVAQYDILRHGKSVGTIEGDRWETSHAIKGESTYATGAWTVKFEDENGRDIEDDEVDFTVRVVGFRRASHHPGSYARAGTSQDVLAALQEAKGIAIDWLVAHPDHH